MLHTEVEFPTKLLCLGDGVINQRQQTAFYLAAVVSELAYDDNPQVALLRDFQQLYDLQLLTDVWVVDPKDVGGLSHRLVIGWSPWLDGAVVGFRGSSTPDDFVADLRVVPQSNSSAGEFPLHSGIEDRAAGIPLHILRRFLESGPLILTGHSLGGGVATIAGLLLLAGTNGSLVQDAWTERDSKASYANSDKPDTFIVPLSIVTFGSPAPLYSAANGTHHASIPESRCKVFHNVFRAGDVVPFLYNYGRSHLSQLHRAAPKAVIATTLIVDKRTWSIQGLIRALSYWHKNEEPAAHIGHLYFAIGYDQSESYRFRQPSTGYDIKALANESIRTTGKLSLEAVIAQHEMRGYRYLWRDSMTSFEEVDAAPVYSRLIAEDFKKRIVRSPLISEGASIQQGSDHLELNVIVDGRLPPYAIIQAALGTTTPVLVADSDVSPRLHNGTIKTSISVLFPINAMIGRSPRQIADESVWREAFRQAATVVLRDIFGDTHKISVQTIRPAGLVDFRDIDTPTFLGREMMRALALEFSMQREMLDPECEEYLEHLLSTFSTLTGRLGRVEREQYRDELPNVYRSSRRLWFGASDALVPLTKINAPEDALPKLPKSSRMTRDTLLVPLNAPAERNSDVKYPKLDFGMLVRDFGELVANNRRLVANSNGLRPDHSNLSPLLDRALAIHIITCLQLRGHTLLKRSAVGSDAKRALTMSVRPGDFMAIVRFHLYVYRAIGFKVEGLSKVIISFVCDALGEPAHPREPERALFNCLQDTPDDRVALKLTQLGLPVDQRIIDWLRLTAVFGEIRSKSMDLTYIGALGQSAIGKSHLWTEAFNIPQDTFNPGGTTSTRTSGIRSIRMGHVMLLDFPGADEGQHVFRQLAGIGFSLLDAAIIMLDFTAIDTELTDFPLLNGPNSNNEETVLRKAALQLKEKPHMPFIILLHKFDNSIDRNYDRIGAINDIKLKKKKVVEQLQQLLGLDEPVRYQYAAGRTSDNKIFWYLNQSKLEDLVHVSTFATTFPPDDFGAPNPATLRELRYLVNQEKLVWDISNVKSWLREVTARGGVLGSLGKV